MSLTDAVRFTERIMTDEALQQRAAAAVEDKEGAEATRALLELAAAEGLHIEPAEMARVRNATLAAAELTDDDLEKVAGGLTNEEWDERLQTVGSEGGELADIDLQEMMRKQQETIAMMESISSVMRATALAVVRKVG